jgi:prolipoprotein diacylglyceryl transferase
MYGLLVSSAILICALISEKIDARIKDKKDVFWGALVWAIIGGVAGARIYHAVDMWEIYLYEPLRLLQVWRGGLGIIGGIVGGTVAMSFYLKRKNEKILPWLDTAARVIPLGQAIGRIGNICNNELLPYAYYEIPFNLGLFLLLNFLPDSLRNKPGRLFVIYVFSYAVIRLALSPLR